MDEPMTQARLLDLVAAGRAEWEATLALVGEARMTSPGLAAGRSVKDVVAHVAWFEREIGPVFSTHVFSGSNLWALPPDERNGAIFAQNRDRPLDQTLREEVVLYDALWTALQSLHDADLRDPMRYRDMPDAWLPWRLIAENTYEHYAAHGAEIRAWLAGAS